MVIAIIVAFVVVIHLQCLVSVYFSLKNKIQCVCEKKNTTGFIRLLTKDQDQQELIYVGLNQLTRMIIIFYDFETSWFSNVLFAKVKETSFYFLLSYL